MSPTYVSGRDIVRPSFQKVGLAGLDRVIHRLNQEIAKIEGATLGGLIRAAIVVRRSMENDAPKTPVDIGNLRASFFTITSDGRVADGASPSFSPGPGIRGKKASPATMEKLASGHAAALSSGAEGVAPGKIWVKLGFSAFYAVFVHEMMGPINWSRPGSGPKWFQAAFRRNVAEILKVIQESARIKK